MLKYLSFILSSIILIVFEVSAQVGLKKFEHISVEQGLSQSNVVCIFQDSEGFMWFGTYDGLNKYDGYKITVYRNNPDDANTISDNYITAIYEDRSGTLWIGTKTSGLCRYNKQKNNFTVFRNNPKNRNSLSSNTVKSIFQDSRGVLWIGTNEGLNKIILKGRTEQSKSNTKSAFLGDSAKNLKINSISTDTATAENDVFIKDGEIVRSYKDVGEVVLTPKELQAIEEDDELEKQLKKYGNKNLSNLIFKKEKYLFKCYIHVPEVPSSLSGNIINKIIESPSGNLLIATENGLDEFDPLTERVILHQTGLVDHNNDPDNINTLLLDKKGILWIGTDHGLKMINRNLGKIKEYVNTANNINSLSHNNVTSIVQDNDDFLWIGTEQAGLNRFDPKTEMFIQYQNDPANPFSLSVDNILVLYQDRADILWIGTYLGGINKWDKSAEGISLYRKNPFDPNSLSSNQIRSIYMDRLRNIWIGTADAGLNRWNINENIFTQYRHNDSQPTSLSHNHVRSIIEDTTGNFWVGTDGGGLDFFNPILGKFKHYKNNKNDPKSLSNNNVWKVFEDSKGRIWVGTQGGLNRFVFEDQSFIIYRNDPEDPNSLSDDKVTTIFEDHLGTIWIGTFGGGLNQWDEVNQGFIKYTYKSGTNSIGDNRIYSIMEDNDGIMWIGTKGNLNKFERDEGDFEIFTEADGLPNNVIMGILEDKAGNLWISTNNGISKFNMNTGEIRNYDIKNGLQSNEFLVGSFYKSNDGRMFFGGINGLNIFYPDSIKTNLHQPQIVITDFKLFNQSVYPGENSPLKFDITKTKEITLTYLQNAFSFEFAALHFSQPEKNQYAYMMENFDKKWINTSAKHRIATYTNLDPGTYLFKVKGSNSDGVWNQEGTYIKIIVLPPFWATFWFRSLLIISILSAFYFTYRYRVRSIEKQKERLEVLVKERTAEVERQNEEISAQRDDLELKNSKIEMQNEQIKSSIRYAQTIQSAILPDDEYIKNFFEHFVIFRPKDIVSGDFYWFSYINEPDNQKLFLATVDCTGHGVPGAFMSMIGSRLLSEVINEMRVFEPNKILDTVNSGVRKALKQDQSENNEGMDVCLCLIERLDDKDKKIKLTYSGAKRPLFYFEHSSNELKVLKGDRKSIGGVISKLENVPFIQQELILEQGDLIYLTTDGIIDQNSPDRRRFGTTNFMDTIRKSIHLPIHIQKETLESTIELYQQEAEQRDDITVIGVKLQSWL